jgi:hypothetical protein
MSSPVQGDKRTADEVCTPAWVMRGLECDPALFQTKPERAPWLFLDFCDFRAVATHLPYRLVLLCRALTSGESSMTLNIRFSSLPWADYPPVNLSLSLDEVCLYSLSLGHES